MVHKIRNKSILKQDVRDRLLKSYTFIGMIADHVGISGQTIERQLRTGSPILTAPHYQVIIRKVLNLPENEIIHELITIGSPELHHE